MIETRKLSTDFSNLIVEPLISTKLQIPRLPAKLVARPHLFRQLDEAVGHKLTLIAAGAGYGKTTLLSAWAALRGKRISLPGARR